APVLRRGQGQRQVLARQQRLAVEPGRAAVPPLDRRRGEDVLPQFLQRRRQGRRAGVALQAADDAQGEIDRGLDAAAVGGGAEEQVRAQYRLHQGAEVVIALAESLGQRRQQFGRRRCRLADEEAVQLAADE